MSVEKHLESKNDVAITSPPSGYVPGRRSSMHGAIDLTKIDTRLYEKKVCWPLCFSRASKNKIVTIRAAIADVDLTAFTMTYHVLEIIYLIQFCFLLFRVKKTKQLFFS